MPSLTLKEEIENKIREMLKSPSTTSYDVLILSKACLLLSANVPPVELTNLEPKTNLFNKDFYYHDYDQTN